VENENLGPGIIYEEMGRQLEWITVLNTLGYSGKQDLYNICKDINENRE